MRTIAPLGAALGLLLGTGAPALAAPTPEEPSGRLVFVQTNDPAGNAVVTFERTATGQLVRVATTKTGGNGGALGGAESDKLASQGSLVYDAGHRMLFAVNAGSDTVTAFRVRGNRLVDRQVLSSGGSFPVSIAVSHDLVYVANALGEGSVAGFRATGGRLQPISGSHRSLGLDPAATPQFVNTPGQVGFSPDGLRLLVTTKLNGNRVEVFGVHSQGRLSAAPVTTTLPGQVPFAFLFDPAGRLLLTEAGTGSLATLQLLRNGRLRTIGSIAGGQAAPCWITAAGGRYYVANTGSNSISGYRVTGGAPSFVVPGGVVANTDPGTIDMTRSGRFLYAMTGVTGALDEFLVRPNGRLVRIGTLAGIIPASAEGIAATSVGIDE